MKSVNSVCFKLPLCQGHLQRGFEACRGTGSRGQDKRSGLNGHKQQKQEASDHKTLHQPLLTWPQGEEEKERRGRGERERGEGRSGQCSFLSNYILFSGIGK